MAVLKKDTGFELEINTFRTVNTKDSPVTMKDDELPILINLMPIGTFLNVVPGFSEVLATIGNSETAWTAAQGVTINTTVRRPTVPNGFIYVASQSGTTDATTEPTWPVDGTTEITDGTAKWKGYSCTIKRFADINIGGTVYKLVATVGGKLYRLDSAYTQVLLNPSTAIIFSDPQFEQWKYTHALIIDPTAGYYSYDGTNLVYRTTPVVTISIATPAVITLNGHGFIAGEPVTFQTTGTLPTGLTLGTTYYVISAGLTANTFEVSETLGGAAVNTSGTQSGVQTLSTAAPTVGTCIAIWKGSVFIASGRTLFFSAPDSFTDFQTISSGGSVIDTYSSLRNQINALVAAQDYLYVVGDHATHTATGIQSFTGAGTVLTLLDTLPGVGSPYPDTVCVLGSEIVHYGNSGVNALSGANFNLLSSMLDGMLPKIDTSFNPVGWFGKIFNKQVYCLLVSAQHPVDGTLQKFILCFYEDRWFYVLYGQDLTFAGQSATAIDMKTFAAYGNNLIEIFIGESLLTKKARLKAMNLGSPILDKQVLWLGATLVNSTGTTNIVATMSAIGSGTKNETGNGSAQVLFAPDEMLWSSDVVDPMPWQVSDTNTTDFIWLQLYSDILGMRECEGRGKRIQIDFEESSISSYAITGIMVGGQYVASR